MNFYDRDTGFTASNDVLSVTKPGAQSRWNFDVSPGTPVVVSYSFPTQAAPYDTSSGAQNGFDGFSPAHQAHTRQALEVWAQSSGISFVEVPQGGDIRFGFIDMSALTDDDGEAFSGFAYFPGSYEQVFELNDEMPLRYLVAHDELGGDVFINRDDFLRDAREMAPGNSGYSLMLHEIGHALGLHHPFEGEPVIASSRDNDRYTVLSYDRAGSTVELGSVDVEAMRLLYGAPDASLAARWNAAEAVLEIDGTGGNDTLLGSHLDEVLTGGAGDDLFRPDGGMNLLEGGAGDDRFDLAEGAHWVNGGAGFDRLRIEDWFDVDDFTGAAGRITYAYEETDVSFEGVEEIWLDSRIYGGTLEIMAVADIFGTGPDIAATDPVADASLTGTDARERIIGAGGNDTLAGGLSADTITGGLGHDSILGGDGDDRITGGAGRDTLNGGYNDDHIDGGAGDDRIAGGNGADTLIGGDGNDQITGGLDADDRRDEIFGGAGNDTIDGGYGNDALRGDAGDDVLSGGFGADRVIGGAGNDRLTAGALGDEIFGSDGDDFLNGGFGYDRLNGGAGADQFFHLGIFDHGSDWVQDYDASAGDTLVFGRAGATAAQFQVNTTFTNGAGADDVAEAFVIFRPTGQIIWALVDGAGQDAVNIAVGGDVFSL